MTGLSIAHARASFAREWVRARHQVALAYVLPAIPSIFAVTLFSDMMSPAEQLAGFPTATFQDYMAPGAVLLAGMMFAGFTAVGVAEDQRNGFADRLRLLGVSPASATVGRLTFEGVRVLPAAVAAYSVAVVLGDDLRLRPVPAVALVALGCTWAAAYNALFHLVALRTANPHAPIALQPLFAVLTFPSTFWYPGALMPSWGEALTAWNPISWLTDAGRAFTTEPFDLWTVTLGLAVVTATGAGLVAAMGLQPREP